VLDMGPEGGERGGRVIAHGTPEQIATVAGSHTGSFLARHYAPHQIPSNGSGGLGHAGSQPIDIVAAPDRAKNARGKFIAPEKKTGMPSARSVEQGKSAAKKSAAKTAKKSAPTSRKKSA
jgi:excinuclease ABC subunit A